MNSARGLFRLHLILGALAAGAVSLAAAVAVRAVDFAALSLTDLIHHCQQALVPSLELHRVAPLVLAGLSTLVVIRAARSAARQLRATRRFLRSLRVIGRIETKPGALLILRPPPFARRFADPIPRAGARAASKP